MQARDDWFTIVYTTRLLLCMRSSASSTMLDTFLAVASRLRSWVLAQRNKGCWHSSCSGNPTWTRISCGWSRTRYLSETLVRALRGVDVLVRQWNNDVSPVLDDNFWTGLSLTRVLTSTIDSYSLPILRSSRDRYVRLVLGVFAHIALVTSG